MVGACYHDHLVSVNDVKKAAMKLKAGKSDSDPLLSSDNFIHACDELYVHLSC
jgi:hypothetical protein